MDFLPGSFIILHGYIGSRIRELIGKVFLFYKGKYRWQVRFFLILQGILIIQGFLVDNPINIKSKAFLGVMFFIFYKGSQQQPFQVSNITIYTKVVYFSALFRIFNNLYYTRS